MPNNNLYIELPEFNSLNESNNTSCFKEVFEAKIFTFIMTIQTKTNKINFLFITVSPSSIDIIHPAISPHKYVSDIRHSTEYL